MVAKSISPPPDWLPAVFGMLQIGTWLNQWTRREFVMLLRPQHGGSATTAASGDAADRLPRLQVNGYFDAPHITRGPIAPFA